MHHSLQLCVGGCPLCRQIANIVEVGKCAGCKLEVFDLSKDFQKVEDLVKRYRIRAVPTLIIDGKIKIEGAPTFRSYATILLTSFLRRTSGFLNNTSPKKLRTFPD
ncbi:MAG: thioredoxin family protein, partial [Candidatus Caldarchaeum sp.]